MNNENYNITGEPIVIPCTSTGIGAITAVGIIHKYQFLKWILLFSILLNINTMNAQDKAPSLNEREQKIVAISAMTSAGDLKNLEIQLNKGLEAGLTINEIKEAMVQLYAYCGFPKSLNALTLFMNVVEERKKAGKSDVEGPVASPLPTDKNMLEIGTEVQTQLVGQPVTGGVMDFAPAIDRYLKEHLFGAIFASDVLNHQQRELVTIAALAVMPGADGQLKSHLNFAMNTGLVKSQLSGIFEVIEREISKKQANKGRAILATIK